MTINFKLIKKFFDEKVGILSNLQTDEKDNLVDAINSISIPTKVSELENDKGYLTEH